MIEAGTVEAYIGGPLSKEELGMVEWLNRLDNSTRQNFMGLLEKSHRFGYISGQVDTRHEKRV